MLNRRKNNLLDYLITGKLHFFLNNYPYFLSVPSIESKSIAHSIYEQTLHSNRFEQWYNNEMAFNILIRRGVISPIINQNLKNLEDSLEDLKVKLFHSMFSSGDDKRIRKELRLVKEQIIYQEKLKTDIHHLTLEGFAAKIKLTILIAASLYDGNTKQRFYNDIEIKNPDPYLIEFIVNKKNELEPTITEIREIARNQPWKSIWNLGKPNPYNKSIISLNDHQQSLMLYSSMYDNIRESLDCPQDHVINDDDLCDGWLIIQNRKREKELKEKQTEQVMGKKAREHQELFVQAKNKEDIKQINAMNDAGTKMIMQQRYNQIKKQKLVKDGDLVDNKIKKQGIVIQQIKERAQK